jgi:hypothetical protein
MIFASVRMLVGYGTLPTGFPERYGRELVRVAIDLLKPLSGTAGGVHQASPDHDGDGGSLLSARFADVDRAGANVRCGESS